MKATLSKSASDEALEFLEIETRLRRLFQSIFAASTRSCLVLPAF
jgi:hypothetical protein